MASLENCYSCYFIASSLLLLVCFGIWYLWRVFFFNKKACLGPVDCPHLGTGFLLEWTSLHRLDPKRIKELPFSERIGVQEIFNWGQLCSLFFFMSVFILPGMHLVAALIQNICLHNFKCKHYAQNTL